MSPHLEIPTNVLPPHYNIKKPTSLVKPTTLRNYHQPPEALLLQKEQIHTINLQKPFFYKMNKSIMKKEDRMNQLRRRDKTPILPFHPPCQSSLSSPSLAYVPHAIFPMQKSHIYIYIIIIIPPNPFLVLLQPLNLFTLYNHIT